MQYHEILELIKAVSQSGLSDFEYTEGNIKISMSRYPREEKAEPTVCLEGEDVTTAETSVMPAEETSALADSDPQQTEDTPQPAPADTGGNMVLSPLVGTFYSGSSEDAPAYVQVGDSVKKGQVLGIVEAMKLMNEIESEYDGVVREILVENGQTVEYGQPLFRIG